MRNQHHAVAVAAFALLVAAPAWAQPGLTPASPAAPAAPPEPQERSSFARLPWALAVAIGVGTPYGAIGVDAELSPREWLALAVGFGSQAGGPTQWMGAVRARYVRRHGAIGFETGLSYGDDHRTCIDLFGDGCESSTVADATWLNAGPYVEVRFPRGLLLRGFAGVTRQLDGGACRGRCPDSAFDRLTYPFAGVAAGLAF